MDPTTEVITNLVLTTLAPNSSNGSDSTPFGPTLTAVLGFLSAAGSLITVLGNILVIAAFFVERALRTPTNYFIASLAVTDLLIGVFSMNFFTLYLLLGVWPLGETFCDIWLSLDYTACLVSQYTVFLITVDRYCSVRIPAKYRNWRTEKKVRVMVAATWILPSSIFFITIMGWPFFTGSRDREKNQCYAEFTQHAVFNTLFTIFYFWITLFVMVALYMGIYKVALNLQRKSDAKRQKMTSLVSMAGQTMSRIGVGVSRASEIGVGGTTNVLERAAGTRNSRRHRDLEDGPGDRRRENHSHTMTTRFTNASSSRDEDRSSSSAFPSDSDQMAAADPLPLPLPLPLPPPSCGRGGRGSVKPQRALPMIESPILVELPSDEEGAKESDAFPEENKPQQQIALGHNRPVGLLNPTPTTSNDSDYQTASATSLDGVGSSERRRTSSNANCTGNHVTQRRSDSIKSQKDSRAGETGISLAERFEGFKYIDQESITSADNLKCLLEVLPRLSSVSSAQDQDSNAPPVWIRRDSKPSESDALGESGRSLPKTASVSVSHENVAFNRDEDVAVVVGPSTSVKTPLVGKVMSYTSQFSRFTSYTTQNSSESGRRKPSLDAPLREVTKKLTRRKRRKGSKKDNSHASRTENRARKALRTITLILGAFVACWTPYHVIILVKGLCDRSMEKGGIYSCVNDHLYNFSYWLCYLNSPINPFCYALANAQFKKTFLRILRLDIRRS